MYIHMYNQPRGSVNCGGIFTSASSSESGWCRSRMEKMTRRAASRSKQDSLFHPKSNGRFSSNFQLESSHPMRCNVPVRQDS